MTSKKPPSRDGSALNPADVNRAAKDLAPQMFDILDQLVRINTHTENRDGIRRAMDSWISALPPGFVLRNPDTAEKDRIWLFFRPGTGPGQPLLLAGHMDTVFPPGMFDQGVRSGAPYLYGPGVADMKGGLVAALGGLWVLERLGRSTGRPILLAVNADEEIGSIHSTPVWEALAREAQAGLVFESGGAGGAVVTARRGLRRYRLDVWGEARHAGFTSEGKRSALVDLAHRVLAIETLNDPERGLTTNVGRIEGGTATNIVPDHAQAWFEMRFWEDALGNQAEARLKKGLAETLAPGVRTEVENGLRRPAMPRTEHIVRLYERARKTARRIGLDLPEERRLGASDANILANAGLAVLDGLGPLGNDGHSLDEYILADSLVDRIIFTAHLVEDLTRV